MKLKLWFILLTVLMVWPCYVSLACLYSYYYGDYPSDQSYLRDENLRGVAIMVVTSLLIVVPYAISLWYFKKQLLTRFVMSTLPPFILMVLMAVYCFFMDVF
jgi:hypothetical protein